MIKVDNLCFSYRQDENVLDNVSLHIQKGEFVAILGHNGSGKSTLAKHFNVLLTPKQGTVIVDGMDTRDETLLYEIRQRVGMVFQNPDNQIVAAIVEEDIAFAPENLGVPTEEIRQRVDWALSTVGMSAYVRHAPHLLSGGQKQKIAIAGVLAMKPKCIILDEPTAMLDPQGRKDVLTTLKKLNDEGITIVLVTHNMDEAVKADRVIIMAEGRIVKEGKPNEVFRHVKEMKDLGLDVPQVTELMYELNLPPALTVDEAYAVLSNELKE